MKRTATTGLVSLGAVLAFAAPCFAHSLHPVFWWLGPVAPLMAIGSVVGCVPLLGIIVGQALLLHYFVPGPTFLGAAWRAAVIFVVSKVAETLPVFINPDVLLGPRSDADDVFTAIVILMPVAAVVAIGLLLSLLYRRMQPEMLKIAGLSLALESISLSGLYLTTTTLWWARLVR